MAALAATCHGPFPCLLSTALARLRNLFDWHSSQPRPSIRGAPLANVVLSLGTEPASAGFFVMKECSEVACRSCAVQFYRPRTVLGSADKIVQRSAFARICYTRAGQSLICVRHRTDGIQSARYRCFFLHGTPENYMDNDNARQSGTNLDPITGAPGAHPVGVGLG